MSARKVGILCLAASLAALSACSPGPSPSSSTGAPESSSPIDAAIDHAMDKIGAKLANENISISDNDSTLPKAEITPRGDLLIAGKPVAVDAAQRAELLAYRGQIIDIARQGIAIGKQGAALGVHAAGTAIAAVFSGASKEQVRARVEAQASGIRKAAAKICDQLPALRSSQQRLAADVPAFKPYATLTQKKVDECRKDALHDDDADRAQIRESIRERIRGGVRSSVQTAAQSAGIASSSSGGAPASTSGVTQH